MTDLLSQPKQTDIAEIARLRTEAIATVQSIRTRCGQIDKHIKTAQFHSISMAVGSLRQSADDLERVIGVTTVKDDRPHKVMTQKEYADLRIIGWHRVCKNIDGAGNVGIQFEGDAPPLTSAEQP